MKIGVLTYHRSINYGAVMQSYALSKRLSEIPEAEVEIIDYMSAKMDHYYKLFTIYRGKNGILRIADRVTMYSAFVNSIHKELPLSETHLVSDRSDEFYRSFKGKYDLIVVGSDAVWNYEKRGLPNPYFLTERISTHQASYAASCNGIDYRRLSEDKLEILGKAFSGFEYLGVRDVLTERVVEKAVGENKAFHNCDPTLLLDFDKDGIGYNVLDSLLRKLEKKYKWDRSKKHIGLMLSNYNGDLSCALIRKIKEKYGTEYQTVAVYSYCKDADIPYVADLTPFEWSRIFSLFDITFSKYFHGTLLSIMNGTPVISLSVEKEFEGIPAKVEDVLQRMDLEEFYYPAKSSSDINWDQFMPFIDRLINDPPVEKMRAGIKKERINSQSFFDYVRACK